MKTTALPTYEEIFGDGEEKAETNFFALRIKRKRYKVICQQVLI